MTHQKHTPTDAELEILQRLWLEGPQSVRQINEKLNEQRPIGYTTTLKIMQIMVEKGIASRDTSARTHIYSALLPREEATSTLLGKLIKAAYNGSATRLVMQALGNHQATPDELAEIKTLIANLEDNQDG